MQQEEGLRKRAKRKACFNVLQQVQPRLAESNWIATCCKTEEFESFALELQLLVFPVFSFDFSVLTFSRSAPTFSSYLSYRPHGRYLVMVLRDPSSLRSVGMTASRFRCLHWADTPVCPTVLVFFLLLRHCAPLVPPPL